MARLNIFGMDDLAVLMITPLSPLGRALGSFSAILIKSKVEGATKHISK